MKILGISAFYHDAAAALLIDGKPVAAAQEERFTRKKHDPSFPANAIRCCLQLANIDLSQVDVIAFYDKPFLKFERLLETYLFFAPRGLTSFIRSMPVWLKEKLFIKQLLRRELRKLGKFDRHKTKMLFPGHHLSHAASAYYPSGFSDAAILTIDGVGEWATATIGWGKDHSIMVCKQLEFPHSVGLLYSAFTYYCGFKVNSGEYKLMGLAPYGNAVSARKLMDIIKTHLVGIRPDGSVFLHQEYFSYATGLKMANDQKWEKLFGLKRRLSDGELSQGYCDLALAIQTVTEEIVLGMAKEAKRLTNSRNLCMAGGVALNCVANSVLLQSGLFEHIFVQPAAGDAGGSLGAALAAHHIYFDRPLLPGYSGDYYLGPANDDTGIERLKQMYGAVATHYEDAALFDYAAKLLNADKIIGWCQGRMEFGPRALGARSILASPKDAGMRQTLNMKIKFREDFRPFAPAVAQEDASEYFDCDSASAHMLFVFQVKEQWRSKLPAITHRDGSARVQTVSRQDNARLHALLMCFKKYSGIPILINTSFNVRGEPIVGTYEHAYGCFMRTGIDYLVLGNHLFDKAQQPPWQDGGERFEPD